MEQGVGDKVTEISLRRIRRQHVLFFDMDGTLIDTNYANYLSYTQAIHQILQTGSDFSYDPNIRFTRVYLKERFPTLEKTEYDKITLLKNRFYADNLPKTELNVIMTDILKRYSKTNTTVLVTNCREERAVMTLKYHDLFNAFNHKFFVHQNNKYEYALASLEISPTSVFVFENEKSEIENAISAGIPCENILYVTKKSKLCVLL